MSNILDLRDLIKELDELRQAKEEGEEFDEDRLVALEALSTQLSDLDEAAENEPTLIPESHWVRYCEELASGCGYLSDTMTNPLMAHIDWDGWAESLKADYSEIEFDGDIYYHRD